MHLMGAETSISWVYFSVLLDSPKMSFLELLDLCESLILFYAPQIEARCTAIIWDCKRTAVYLQR